MYTGLAVVKCRDTKVTVWLLWLNFELTSLKQVVTEVRITEIKIRLGGLGLLRLEILRLELRYVLC